MGLALKIIRVTNPDPHLKATWGYSHFREFQEGVAEVVGSGVDVDPALFRLTGHSYADGTLDREQCVALADAMHAVKRAQFARIETEKARPYEMFWADFIDFMDLLEAVVLDEDAHGLAFM